MSLGVFIGWNMSISGPSWIAAAALSHAAVLCPAYAHKRAHTSTRISQLTHMPMCTSVHISTHMSAYISTHVRTCSMHEAGPTGTSFTHTLVLSQVGHPGLDFRL